MFESGGLFLVKEGSVGQNLAKNCHMRPSNGENMTKFGKFLTICELNNSASKNKFNNISKLRL